MASPAPARDEMRQVLSNNFPPLQQTHSCSVWFLSCNKHLSCPTTARRSPYFLRPNGTHILSSCLHLFPWFMLRGARIDLGSAGLRGSRSCPGIILAFYTQQPEYPQ